MVKRYVRCGCGCKGQTGWPSERTPAKCEQVHDVTNAAVNADEAKSEVRVAERERVEVSERERGGEGGRRVAPTKTYSPNGGVTITRAEAAAAAPSVKCRRQAAATGGDGGGSAAPSVTAAAAEAAALAAAAAAVHQS